METRTVRYEDFGAIGDGKHDDMPAIVACHAYANENGAEVYATDGATYYIGGKNLTATIKTSVHWGKAKFTIDDVNLENIKADVFSVETDSESFTPDIKTLTSGQRRVDFPHEGKVFVHVVNDNKKVYIRKGLNRNAGSGAADSFVVDGDGAVFGDINWDYPTITKIYAKSADDAPVVIEGGEFTTIANQAESFYNYHKRGISITRSNVTVRGLTHYVIGEGEHGAPYNGFIGVGECYNFTIEDCMLTPHFIYRTEGADPGSKVSMGTYDFTLSGTVGVTMRRVTQSRDITDRAYWGLMGTNFSKEVLLEDCVISRYDAHCGVTNGAIKNCTLGHQGFNLIGFGDFTVENTTVKSYAFINLRSDYGSFFHGKLHVKNCVWDAYGANRTLFSADNTGDHDFGYECGMPSEINIDGLRIIDNAPDDERKFYLFPIYDGDYSDGKPYPYGTPDTVVLKNVSVTTGRALELAQNPELYKNTKLIIS